MKLFLYVITLILMLISTYAALIYAPTETIMGNIQRIFYFHMGTVWVATIAFMIVFVASIIYLINGKKKWDVLAYTSAEIGVLFITLTIITGSIWAKPVWGTWWTWDPQLTTTFILWILYIVYLLIRANSGFDEKKAKYSAVFAIIAFIDLPLVYISARVMRGISPVVFGPGGHLGVAARRSRRAARTRGAARQPAAAQARRSDGDLARADRRTISGVWQSRHHRRQRGRPARPYGR